MRSNRYRSFLFGLIVAGTIPSLSLYSQCKPDSSIFYDGERVAYEISYNWGPVWVDAGIVYFETKLEQRNGRSVYHLVSSGRTYRTYDLLFKVRDTYETWIDPDSFQTQEFRRYIYEGGYQLQNTSFFNYPQQQIISYTKRNENPLVVDTIMMKHCTYDMLASVYYVRSLPLNQYAVNDTFHVQVAIDDSIYQIGIRCMGRETIIHPDDQAYQCVKFSAKMVEGTIFTKNQEVMVWLTDDLNKVPVYIEARILVGSIKAYLKNATGLKYPLYPIQPEK